MEQQNQGFGMQQPIAPVMTLGNWIVTYLLLMIPLVNIILVIVWAVSKTENPNRKNWAQAMLIFWAVALVLWLAFALIFGGSILGTMNSLA